MQIAEPQWLDTLPKSCTPQEGEDHFYSIAEQLNDAKQKDFAEISQIMFVGLDEAGRGPLAGTVVAAAVVLPRQYDLPWLNDSKKLSEKKRETLFPLIQEQALAWGIGEASAIEIDEINILQGSFLAMRRALEMVRKKLKKHESDIPIEALLLVDGNHRISKLPPEVQLPVVKGDGRVACIAAASVLAKVTRDRQLIDLDKQYPQYGFKQNKGYPSKSHVEAIRQFGYCDAHRKSFKVKALDQTDLFTS